MYSQALYAKVAQTLLKATGISVRQHSTALPELKRVAALRERVAVESPDLYSFASGEMGAGAAAVRSGASALPEHAAALAAEASPLLREDESPRLMDRFSRRHTYLRISLTERCSLRCVYCMPADGVELTRPERLLSAEETIRLATIFVRAGVDKIRLTGGEPTVRPDLVPIVSALNKLRPLGLKQIGMTTNGIALSRQLPQLHAAGLDKLNISLDTLDAKKFNELTRRDALSKVLKAIDVAIELGYAPLKLNCVVMRGVNDSEVVAFRWAPVKQYIYIYMYQHMYLYIYACI